MRLFSICCFCLLGVLLLLGERTLFLFDGDRELAARGTVAMVTLLGGLGFAFAQPGIWRWFAIWLQKLVRAGGVQSPLAQLILAPRFNRHIWQAALVLCAAFACASIGLALSFWISGLE